MLVKFIISLIVNVSPALQITITINYWFVVYKPFQIVELKPVHALANVQAAPQDSSLFQVDYNVAQAWCTN